MSDFGDASHKTAKKELNLAQDICMVLRDYEYFVQKLESCSNVKKRKRYV